MYRIGVHAFTPRRETSILIRVAGPLGECRLDAQQHEQGRQHKRALPHEQPHVGERRERDGIERGERPAVQQEGCRTSVVMASRSERRRVITRYVMKAASIDAMIWVPVSTSQMNGRNKTVTAPCGRLSGVNVVFPPPPSSISPDSVEPA